VSTRLGLLVLLAGALVGLFVVVLGWPLWEGVLAVGVGVVGGVLVARLA
jgi:hypothetical protein